MAIDPKTFQTTPIESDTKTLSTDIAKITDDWVNYTNGVAGNQPWGQLIYNATQSELGSIMGTPTLGQQEFQAAYFTGLAVQSLAILTRLGLGNQTAFLQQYLQSAVAPLAPLLASENDGIGLAFLGGLTSKGAGSFSPLPGQLTPVLANLANGSPNLREVFTGLNNSAQGFLTTFNATPGANIQQQFDTLVPKVLAGLPA